MGIIKTGLYCLIGILCALILLKFFIPDDPDQPDWPEQLLMQREAFEEQHLESEWQARIDQAGQNESQLESEALKAIEAGNYLAAYKAATLLRPGEKKNSVMMALFSAGIGKCATIGWSLSALQGIDSSKRQQMESTLLEKWEECQSSQN